MVGFSEGVKLLATAWFFLHEAAFARAKKKYPIVFLPSDSSVIKYVKGMLKSVLLLGKGRPTDCCSPYESLEKHVPRSRSVFQMWQGGFQVKMPKLEFKGEGWVVDPEGREGKDALLTAGNLVIQLSEHCYVETNRKTRLLTCGAVIRKRPQTTTAGARGMPARA